MIKKNDLIKVADKTLYYPNDYHNKFYIDEDNLDFEDEIKFHSFDYVFRKMKTFRSKINPYLKNQLHYIKFFLVFFFTKRDDLMIEMRNIEGAIIDIEDQIDELKYEIEDIDEEIERVEGSFEEASNELESFTNTNGIALSRSIENIDMRKQYTINYNDLDEDEKDQVDDLFIEMQDYKDEYWGFINDKSLYEDFIDKARKNLEEAKVWEDKLEKYNYD